MDRREKWRNVTHIHKIVCHIKTNKNINSKCTVKVCLKMYS